MGVDASVYGDDDDEHEIASVRLGNLSAIMDLRKTIGEKAPLSPILLEKVLCSGTHSGGRLSREDVRKVKFELLEIRRLISGDDHVRQFVADFDRIVEVALQHDRPITF